MFITYFLRFIECESDNITAISRALNTPELLQNIAEFMERRALAASLTVSKFWHDNAIFEARKRNIVIRCRPIKTSIRTIEFYCTWSDGKLMLPWENFNAHGLLVTILTENDHDLNRLPKRVPQ